MRAKNRYDWLIILTIACISFGNVGMPVSVLRFLSLIFMPYVFVHFAQLKKELSVSAGNFLAIWLMFSVCSLTFTPLFFDGLKNVIYNICSVSIFLSLFLFATKANNPYRSIIIGWVLVVLVTSPIAFWELITNHHLSYNFMDEMMPGLQLGDYRRYASVTFGNLNSYVVRLLYCMPFILVALFDSYKRMNIWLIISLIISLCIILVNASRGGMLCFLGGFMVFCVFLVRYRRLGMIHIIGGLVAVLLIYRYSDLILSQFCARLVSGEGLTMDTGRFDIYKNCLVAFRDSYGLGTGIGSLTYVLENISPNDIPIPHNLFLELLAEYGVMPFVFFVAFFVCLCLGLIHSSQVKIKLLGWIVMITILPLSVIDSGYVASTHIWVFLSCLLIMRRIGLKPDLV